MSPSGPSLSLNGAPLPLAGVPVSERLLDTIRWRVGLRGTKEGCRSGDCGACTVLVDGQSVLSCLVLTRELEGSEVTTVEGIADEPEGARAAEAMVGAGAVQCGYCTPGLVMALASLLKERGSAGSPEEFLADLQGNLCRCTGYRAIVAAALRARTGEAPP
ncbi:MAG: 2Fe-2S iron-sulfur cluster-binding protein [Thermoplasmata archaeon]